MSKIFLNLPVSFNNKLIKLTCASVLVLGMGCASASAIDRADDEPVEHAEPIDDRETGGSILGNYLAGRVAKDERDNDNASLFFRRALENDPDNDLLLQHSLSLDVSAGNWAQIYETAKKVLAKNEKHHIARLVIGVEDFRNGNYVEARKHFAKAGRSPLSVLVSVLSQSWAYKAEGLTELSYKKLSELDKQSWARFYQLYHKALIADLSGSQKTATRLYKTLFSQEQRTLRLALAYAHHEMARKRWNKANSIMQQHLDSAPAHSLSVDLLERIESRSRTSYFIPDAAQGLAEVFFGIGDALTSEGGVDIGTIYLQLALRLRPDFPIAQMTLAEVYEDAKQYSLSNQAYGTIGEDSPLWSSVVIRKAFNLNASNRVDEAKELLDYLLKTEPTNIAALEAQGNIMRSHKKYKEAVKYLTLAIKQIDKPEQADWKYYYSRGVSYERLDNWKASEKDLLKAMKLNPNQPLVLNYLGYSWVDKGLHLKKAMGYIRRAVQEKPDDGYFVDSLGWANFRLGHYDMATKELEHAVELLPNDPILNDHLGDAFWRVGRKTEARYQWMQALDLKAEPSDAKKIRVKLENGLPADKKNGGRIAAIVVPKTGQKQKFADIVKASVTEKEKVKLKGVVQPAVHEEQDKVHTVRSGETLWTIAQKYYGRANGAKYKRIEKINKSIIGRKGLKPGMKIKIPGRI